MAKIIPTFGAISWISCWCQITKVERVSWRQRSNVRDFCSGHFKSVMVEEALKSLKNVEIDNGKFKYILIKVYDPDNEDKQKYIVRGNGSCAFHGDIYDQVSPMITRLGLEPECVGGGRIQHDPVAKTIHVYGYSQGYGKADHSVSCEILKEHFPDYSKIYFSNEGY